MKRFLSISKLFSRAEPDLAPPAHQDLQAAAEAAKNRGNTFVAAGDYLAAAQCYLEALKLLPSYAEAHVNLGSAYRALGRLQEAKVELQTAVALKPSLWQGHFQLGLLLGDLGEFQHAIDSFHQSLAINPGVPECRWQLGIALVGLEKWADAIEALESPTIPEDGFSDAHMNLGLALSKVGRLHDALHQYQIALQLNKSPQVHFLIGQIYEELSMQHEAELSHVNYRRAVESDPGDARSHFHLSFQLLLRGDYRSGFQYYERRLELDDHAQALVPMRSVLAVVGQDRYWKGQDIAGAKIVIITEQGLGDALMMLRYLPLLKTVKHAAKVCVVCDEQLVKIVQGVPEVDEVRAHPATIYPNEFDWCCSVMSLPSAFGTELSTIPSSANLLVTSEQSRQKWADRLRGLDGLKVGVAWTGNKALAANAIRSIPLGTLARLFPTPGIVWINLQKGEAAGELKGMGWPVHDWMDDAQDLMDTAALIDCLDLVITVDTSIVHLAGVLNRPTWLLNRYDTEWRWHKEREDSPWYPSVRVFRQSMPNDWSGVIGNVAEDLRHKLAS